MQETQAIVAEDDTTFGSVHDDVVAEMDVDGPSLTEPASASDSTMGEARLAERRETAHDLVETFSSYDLDYTPESFEELDRLVEENYDSSPDDVDRGEQIADSAPGTIPGGVELKIETSGAPFHIASYVGEVFCRTYGADWHTGDGFDHLLLEIHGKGWLKIEPHLLASGARAGYISCERYHDSLVDQFGLDPED